MLGNGFLIYCFFGRFSDRLRPFKNPLDPFYGFIEIYEEYQRNSQSDFRKNDF